MIMFADAAPACFKPGLGTRDPGAGTTRFRMHGDRFRQPFDSRAFVKDVPATFRAFPEPRVPDPESRDQAENPT